MATDIYLLSRNYNFYSSLKNLQGRPSSQYEAFDVIEIQPLANRIPPLSYSFFASSPPQSGNSFYRPTSNHQIAMQRFSWPLSVARMIISSYFDTI